MPQAQEETFLRRVEIEVLKCSLTYMTYELGVKPS